jgi:hypothetical protein
MTVQQSVPVATSKPKVDFQEIHQLIESFQQLLLTTPPNVNRGLPVDTNMRFVKIQKQSAIDNFHSIADSLLNVFPTKTNPNIRRSKLGPQRNTHTQQLLKGFYQLMNFLKINFWLASSNRNRLLNCHK